MKTSVTSWRVYLATARKAQIVMVMCLVALAWDLAASGLIAAVTISPSPSFVAATGRVISGRPGNVFTVSEPLTFRFGVPVATPCDWRVRDWRGRLIARGVIAGESRALTLPPLPLGYYELQIKTKGARAWQRFVPLARVVDPASRRLNPQSPFCVDSAQSELTAPHFMGNKLQPPHANRLCSELERLAGLTMVRDRMSWSQTNPKPGVYTWGRYETTVGLLARRGIRVLNVFDPRDTPAWVGGWGRHLLALYRYTRELAKQFAGRTTAWEFSNEEDGLIAASRITTWTFAAEQKVAYLGFKAGDPRTLVLNGPLGSINSTHFLHAIRTHTLVLNNGLLSAVYPRRHILNLMLQNGMGDYFDVFSFHDYNLRTYGWDVQGVRTLLARYGYAKPLWVSEAGFATAGRGRPLQAGSLLREADAVQAREQAEAVVKEEVTLHALGVARVFFFVFPPYNEGDGVWGLFRWDWTVKPGYVALANLTAQLGDSHYLGPLALGPGVHGYLFRQIEKSPRRQTAARSAARSAQTLVVWADTKKMILLPTLSARVKHLERVNLMGRAIALPPERDGRYRLTVGAAPIYVDGLLGLRPSAAPPVPGTIPAKPSGKNLTTVLRVKLGRGFTAAGYYATLHQQQAHAVVEVYNFSRRPVRGIVRNCGAGWAVNDLPRRFTVPPMSHVYTSVRIHLTAAGRQVAQRHPLKLILLKLDGRFDDQPIDPVVIPIRCPLAPWLALSRRRSLDVVNPARWNANASGKMTIAVNPRKHAIQFHVVFPSHSDHWVYPDFPLRLPGENLAGSVGISFQIKRQSWGCNLLGPPMGLLMAVNTKGKGHSFPYQFSSFWRTAYVVWGHKPPGGFNPAKVVMLRIGCNPRQKHFTYWVRNLQVYYQRSCGSSR